MDSNMKSQDKEIDEDVQELIKDFDMNEYGNVAENGWYLIKRVISLKKRWQDEAELEARIDELKTTCAWLQNKMRKIVKVKDICDSMYFRAEQLNQLKRKDKK